MFDSSDEDEVEDEEAGEYGSGHEAAGAELHSVVDGDAGVDAQSQHLRSLSIADPESTGDDETVRPESLPSVPFLPSAHYI